jgi:hypothetical protein
LLQSAQESRFARAAVAQHHQLQPLSDGHWHTG